MKSLGVWFVFSVFIVAGSSTGITFTDGGYDNILVGFSDQIKPPRDCSDVLDTLEASFHNLSTSLYLASGSRAHIRSVTVLLPRSWNLIACNRRAGRNYGESFPDSDFRVVPNHAVLLDSVWTQQSRRCGEEGDYVNLPYNFFGAKLVSLERYGNLGKTLLHEWAKYRYGVFDEFGFPNDPLYPAWYRSNGEVSHTGCSNLPVVGSTLGGCDPSRADCQFRPSLANNTEVKTSLMYLPYLTNVTDFCDANSHKDGPPTKHNVLCNGRSTKEVILGHQDFRASFQPVFANVSFTYKQPRAGRYVLALDTSSGMNERDTLRFARVALRRFLLKDMPNGTEVGLVSFAAKAEALTNATVSLTNDSGRLYAFSKVPGFSDSKPEKCFRCAVEESIKLMEANGFSALGHTIIVITTGLSSPDLASGLALAKSKKVKVSAISLSGNLDGLKNLAGETGGILSVVQGSYLSMVIQLGDSLLQVLNYHQIDGTVDEAAPILVHEAEFPGTGFRRIVNGSFFIDSTLEETTFALYFPSRDNPAVQRLWLRAPDGSVREAWSEEPMASLYFSPIRAIVGVGIWSYSFEHELSSQESHFVKVTSRPRLTKPSVATRLFFSEKSSNIDVTKRPLVVYAEVKQGDMPVVDASVRVLIQYASDNRTNEFDLQLLDNGKGDPDITANDGIYSRYFLPPSGGLLDYTMTLFVSDNSGKAYTVRTVSQRSRRAATIQPESTLCCGSSIQIPLDSREYVGSFQRIVRSPPLAIYATGADMFPPSRVTDLRADVWNRTVYLSWTAPGGSYDSGSAYSYELRYARTAAELRTAFSAAPTIPLPDAPLDYGTPSTFNFTFPNYDTTYYLALRALDTEFNKGAVSNVVSVFVPAPPTTTTTTIAPTTAPPTLSAQTLSLAAILGIAAGAFLAVVLIVLACCMAVYKRKRQTKDPKYQNSTLYNQTKSNGITNSGLKEPEKLLKIGGDENDGKSLSVIYEPNLPSNPPVHWSASQLLAEHERRQSPYVGNQNYNHYETNNNPNVQAYYPGLTPENNGSVYNGYYHNAPTLPYPQNNDRYSPYGRGSSPPTDSVHSGNSDGKMLPNEYDTSVEYSQNSVKVPPPTLPKPVRPVPPSTLQAGSFTSLASDKKKRNITQV